MEEIIVNLLFRRNLNNSYHELFKNINNTYTYVYAYYNDLLFDETLTRHQSKSNSSELCEDEMKHWWNKKDYIYIIPDKTLTKDIRWESKNVKKCNELF